MRFIPPTWPRLRRYCPLALAVLLAPALPGCRPRDGRPNVRERLVMQCNFESMTSILPDSLLSALTQRRAHSGRYATRVDSAQEYSMSYRVRLGQIFPVQVRKLHVSGWVWVPRYEDDAALVAAVSAPNDPNKSVVYQAFSVADSGPYQEWKPVSLDVDMPYEAGYDSQLTVYLWRRNAQQPVYLDDLRITEIR